MFVISFYKECLIDSNAQIMSNLKKTKSTLKKQTPLNPAFQNRRTVADHVRDNMLCAGRSSYFQRIIYIGKHKKEDVNIKDVYNNIINDVNKNAPGELLSGEIF